MKLRKPWFKKYYSLFIMLVAIIVVATSVAAYYMRNTGEVKNTFNPAGSVNPIIEETFENNVKSDVYVKVGETEYPVYVRVALDITWQDNEGTVYFFKPAEGVDYNLDLDLKPDGWIKGSDGYYYYTKPIESGGNTPVLIKECKPIYSSNTSSLPEGYTLSVNVIVQTIQAVGTTDTSNIPAYQDAWGIKFEEN